MMGSYGIGVGRLLACMAEEHRDEEGLVWPVSVAPYHVHLADSDHKVAQSLYEGLASAGVEVPCDDDRQESLGTKFKIANLIGAPIRLTLTPRSLENGGVEMKPRRERERSDSARGRSRQGRPAENLRTRSRACGNGPETVTSGFSVPGGPENRPQGVMCGRCVGA